MSVDKFLGAQDDERYLKSALYSLEQEYWSAKLEHGPMSIDGESMTDFRRIAALGAGFGEVYAELTYDKQDTRDTTPDERLFAELIKTANVALTWATYLKRTGRM